MVKSIVVVLAIAVISAHCGVLRNEDSPLKRVTRSCEPCEQKRNGPPGPPGPPPHGPFFHAHQWSGFARNAAGSPEAVFSGATAAADGGAQASGQAFSIAASEANSGTINGPKRPPGGFNPPVVSSGYGGQSGQYAESHFSNKNEESQQFKSQGGYGSQSGHGFQSGHQSSLGGHGSQEAQGAAQSQAESTSFSDNEGQQQEKHLDTGIARGDQYREFHGSKQVEKFQDQQQEGNEDQQQEKHLGSGIARGDQYKESHGSKQFGKLEDLQQESQHGHGVSGFGAGGSGAGFGGGAGSKGVGANSAGAGAAYEADKSSGNGGIGSGSGVGVASGAEAGVGTGLAYGPQESTQSALNGALGLASQGLQTAQQTGCATCGKSSYALSNARTHSGNAIALSIGG